MTDWDYSELSETLEMMADNIDATRPEQDYSAAHKRVDDADIATLRDAAEAIRKLHNQLHNAVKSIGEERARRDSVLAALEEARRAAFLNHLMVCTLSTGREVAKEDYVQIMEGFYSALGWPPPERKEEVAND